MCVPRCTACNLIASSRGIKRGVESCCPDRLMSSLMKTYFGKALILAIPLCLASTSHIQATPSSGIVMSDQIIGTTPTSYFVIRTTKLRPPTYYRFHERIEFVELSIPNGNVQHRCKLRETDNQSDAGAKKETWKRTELKMAACRPYDTMSRRNARYVEPRSRDGAAYRFRLTADGVSVKEAWSEDDSKWNSVLSMKKLKRRAASVATISTATIPWKTHAPSGGNYDLLWLETDDQPFHEACNLDPIATTSIGTHWVFLRLLCWSGDDDVDGANFYIPINSKAWLKDAN